MGRIGGDLSCQIAQLALAPPAALQRWFRRSGRQPHANPDPGFQAAKARTSDLVAQAKQDAERQPLSVTDPVEVESSVDSAVDAIAVKLDEKRVAAGPQLPGRSGSGGRIDIRV